MKLYMSKTTHRASTHTLTSELNEEVEMVLTKIWRPLFRPFFRSIKGCIIWRRFRPFFRSITKDQLYTLFTKSLFNKSQRSISASNEWFHANVSVLFLSNFYRTQMTFFSIFTLLTFSMPKNNVAGNSGMPLSGNLWN